MYAGKSIISGAEEVVRTLDRIQPVDGEQRQLALFCEDQFWAWAFKYVVEMRRPDVHVVSLIHINLLEHYAAELDAQDFDYLVHLGDHGVESWTPEPSTGLPAQLKAPTNEGARHFARFMRGLQRRSLLHHSAAQGRSTPSSEAQSGGEPREPQNRFGPAVLRRQWATQDSPLPDAAARVKPIFITAGGGSARQPCDSTIT